MFEQAVTNNVSVEVQSRYIADQSEPADQRFFFGYKVRIQNRGSQPVQLLTRHWVITDGQGRVEEVKGAGVIGQQPKLAPNETFEYESFCPLPTPTGVMKGTYQMIGDDGSKFDVKIPQFFLVEPNSFH